MDAFYTFAAAHPVLTAWLALIVAYAWSKAFSTLFVCWNRLMRHRNIKAQGWPPIHLDADGDQLSE